MSIDRDRRRERHHSSRSHRSSRTFSREQPGLREPSKHDSESSHPQTSSHRSVQGSHLDKASRKQERERRRQRQRSRSSIPSPLTETPITAALSDLRDDIQETNFSPIHTSTFYGYTGEGDNTLVREKPLGPVYVENRSGFSQISRERAFDSSLGRDGRLLGYWHQYHREAAPKENKPVHLAINAQTYWMSFAIFCHGILAGVSFMQTILVEVIASSTAENLAKFASIYGKLSQLLSVAIYILISLCFISVLDRLDISHADCRQFLNICNTRPRLSWLLVPLYTTALIVTLLAARTDDWLALENLANFSLAVNVTKNSDGQTENEMFGLWRIDNIVRSSCVSFGWLILATTRPKDLLHHHLKTMLRHPPIVRIS